MNNKEKLTKIIQYAIGRGLVEFHLNNCTTWYVCEKCEHMEGLHLVVDCTYDDNFSEAEVKRKGNVHVYSLNDVIFNHEFCKCVFGEVEEKVIGYIERQYLIYGEDFYKNIISVEDWNKLPSVFQDMYGEVSRENPGWQYHIVKLAQSDDRIDYLYNFIEK